ncbi:MAG TPA: type II toxin-antitoxin system RelE/ParE family toxin [Acidimicrobiales bacterium]|nr:type II toxin-antitoxin system RelE/ParE family toxin [Acidimicrobiales bacterium]
MDAMSWGEVELEPEVRDWFLRLGETDQARVRFHVDRLSELGPVLDEPHTRQLDGKLRELRFYLAGVPTRITYWIAPGRRIILLTVFVKTKRKDVREVQRARDAMERCTTEEHVADEEENDDDG